MMKTFKCLFLVVAFWLHANASAEAAIIFVNSWDLGALSSPYLAGNQPTNYTAQEAAAVLFGGTAADYMISTVDSNPLNINNMAWVDGFGDSQYLVNPAAENFKGNAGSVGYNVTGDFSALVNDNAIAGANINYAFINQIAAVPEPASAAFLGLGSLALVVRRLRRRNTVIA
jgi:hypothetical protein